MRIIATHTYQSPAGALRLGAIDEQLCLCDWPNRNHRHSIDKRISQSLKASFNEQENDVLTRAMTQLDEYFAGERTEFTIDLHPIGSDFQQQVWRSLQEIPYGHIQSYSALADALGSPTAVRAVANANGANALSIFIPCHRVIGKNNQLTGYAGGLEAKQHLLALERSALKLTA